jgi:spermidine synthase
MKNLIKYGPFPVAVFLGAFLLFQVQPMIGKYFLPWFGGAPAVWMTCLMFFQLLLLGGYAYAHFLQGLASRRQVLVHAGLLATAVAVGFFLLVKWDSPILPSTSLRASGQENPTWKVLQLLFISIGFPYFLLSTSASLLQAWFHKVDSKRSPYVFYVVSNAASLLALISYPVVVEPNFTIQVQAMLWSAAFLVYVGLCLWCIYKVWTSKIQDADTAIKTDNKAKVPSRPVLWILVSFCGVLALMAVTNQMTQDIPPVPFLWILPLSLYLLSFIIGFSERQRSWGTAYIYMLICALVLVFYITREGLDLEIKKQVAGYSFILFSICLFCHNSLYASKPDPKHLTGFYLCISLGGALGGIFVVLVAPFLFNGYWEYPLCLVLGGALAIRVIYTEPGPRAMFGKIRHVLPLLLLGYAVFLGNEIAKDIRSSVFMERNFFGGVRVDLEYNRGIPIYTLMHGKINHGMQIDHPRFRTRPTTYFTESSGVGMAIKFKQHAGPVRIGVLGLGIGTLAAYGRDGDSFRMYEIDPVVVTLAKDSPWFSYLADSKADITVITGDGRLCLENELEQLGSNQFDLLALDAFSGDSPPAHLLTLEAFELYLSHLEKDGILAVNISNRYLDLLPVLNRVQEVYELEVAYIVSPGDMKISAAAQWILLSRNSSLVNHRNIARANSFNRQEIREIRPWSDKFSNLFSVMK